MSSTQSEMQDVIMIGKLNKTIINVINFIKHNFKNDVISAEIEERINQSAARIINAKKINRKNFSINEKYQNEYQNNTIQNYGFLNNTLDYLHSVINAC